MQIKLCYFNDMWNVYIYTTEGYENWTEKSTLQTIREESTSTSLFSCGNGEYRLRTYQHPVIPIYTYGFMADNPKQRPGHGGEWSSNTTQINKAFGIDIIEVGVDQIGAAVDTKWLKDILGDKVTWETHPIYRERISHITGEENTYMKWVTVIDK